MKSIRSDLPRLKLVLFCTLAFSLAAHAYMYFTFAPSHDALSSIINTTGEARFQVTLGRFMTGVYWPVRGWLPVPWLVGLLSILYRAAGSYLIMAVLGIERRLSVVLLCGVLSVNLAVTATSATYIYIIDSNMLAMLLACVGVWLWERLPRCGALAAVPCFACSMGFYQAYIDVAIGLALLMLIRRVLDGEPFSALWRRALRYALSLLGGGALYFILVKCITHLMNTQLLTGYNYNELYKFFDAGSLDLLSMLKQIPYAYFSFAAFFLSPLRSYNTPAIILCRCALGLVGLALWVRCIRSRRIRGLELLFLLACAALLPLGLNFVYVLSGGHTHDLMVYSFYLIYILPLMPLELQLPPRFSSVCKTTAACLCAYALFFNVVFANGAYFKKQLLYESSSQYVFSIVEQMERCPEYEPGVTPVAIIGEFPSSYLAGDANDYFSLYRDMTGIWNDTSSFTYRDTFNKYCQFILGHPVKTISDEAALLEIQYRRATLLMPVFPKDGFCQMQDGVMVVKLS